MVTIKAEFYEWRQFGPAGRKAWELSVVDADGKLRVVASSCGNGDIVTCSSFLNPKAVPALADALARYARHGVLQPPTRVCSVRGMTADEIAAAGIVYVGRKVLTPSSGLDRTKVKLPGHPLANPFKVPHGAGKETRAKCVAQYRKWLRDPIDKVKRDMEVNALRGKLLGCWCGEWDGFSTPGFVCHAIELAKLAEE